MTDAPKGFIRAQDGVLEIDFRFGALRRDNTEEAIRENGAFVCGARVYRAGAWGSSHCRKPAKHDPDCNGNLTRCGIHSAESKAKRKAKTDAKDAEERAKIHRQVIVSNLRREALAIVRKVADGHNDPRALCADWVSRMDAIKEESK